MTATPLPTPSRGPRLCFFSHSAELGGAQRSLLELVSELVGEHACRCAVVLPRAGPLESELARAGVERVRAPYSWWCDADPVGAPEVRRRTTRSLEALLDGPLAAIAGFDPHVVVTSTLVIPWGAVAAGLLGKPHLWMVSEYGERDHGLRFFLPFDEVVAIVRDVSAAVVTNSEALRRELFGELSDDRCLVLHRHVAIPPAAVDRAPSGHYARPGAVRLGLFATLREGKGQEDALAAAAMLVAAGHDVELLLAGRSSPASRRRLERTARERGVAERVRFAGFVSDVYAAMRETDIVVVCSRHEAFGRVAVEALLLEKPVVYAASGGLLESMIDGETGLAYPPGDAAALADRLRRLILEPELARALAARGREHVRQRFPRHAFGGGFLRVVERLRGDGAAPRAGGVRPAVAAGVSRARGELLERWLVAATGPAALGAGGR